MTTEEAIHRAALRKHRHKGNYIETHEALMAEAEYLQQTGKPIQLDWVTLMFTSLFMALVTSGIAAIAMIWWLS